MLKTHITIAQRSTLRRINVYPQTPIDDAASVAGFTSTMALSPSLISNHSSPSSDGSRQSLHERGTWISGRELSVQGPSAQGGAMQLDTASAMQFNIVSHTDFGYQAAPPSAIESPQNTTPTMYGHYSTQYPQVISRSAPERARHPSQSQTPLALPQEYVSASMSMFPPSGMQGEADITSNPMHFQPDVDHHRSSSARINSPRVQDLVAENSQLQRRIRQLEAELNASRSGYNGYSPSGSSAHMSPMLPMTPSPQMSGQPPSYPISDEFRASWEARRAARVKRFCALNRAGNSLCSWHDSRRERRQYPARNAPPGILNCGCTYDQALFEESLSRHNVGSYHPGDSVRMDPALRNPLLTLLEERYGYRDGDFERDPRTGAWIEGEGHEKWEALLASGPSRLQSRK